MITTLILMFLLGSSLAWRFRTMQEWGGFTGVALLLGFGVASHVLLGFSLLGVPWNRAIFLLTLVVISGAAAALALRTSASPGSLRSANTTSGSALIFAVTMLAVIGHLVFLTLAPPFENDFLAIWGLKGKVFFERGTVDWGFLSRPWNTYLHPGYPLLVPLTYSAFAVGAGGWDDALLGGVTSLMGLGAILVVRHELHIAFGRAVAAELSTLILAFLLLSPRPGLADGPLTAYAICAVLLVRRGVLTDHNGTVLLGAVLAGLAALTKNEGQVIVLGMSVALLLDSSSRSRLRLLWPAWILTGAWLVVRLGAGLGAEISISEAPARIASRLMEPAQLIGALTEYSGARPILWLGIAVGMLVAGRSLWRRERYVLSIAALQGLAYLVAYLATPHDLVWHIRWSWDRLSMHLAPLLVVALALNAAYNSNRASGAKAEVSYEV